MGHINNIKFYDWLVKKDPYNLVFEDFSSITRNKFTSPKDVYHTSPNNEAIFYMMYLTSHNKRDLAINLSCRALSSTFLHMTPACSKASLDLIRHLIEKNDGSNVLSQDLFIEIVKIVNSQYTVDPPSNTYSKAANIVLDSVILLISLPATSLDNLRYYPYFQAIVSHMDDFFLLTEDRSSSITFVRNLGYFPDDPYKFVPNTPDSFESLGIATSLTEDDLDQLTTHLQNIFIIFSNYPDNHIFTHYDHTFLDHIKSLYCTYSTIQKGN